MTLSITLIIIIITCIVSLTAFSNEKILDDLIFYPPAISGQNQFYRFFTCGFIHANYGHLFFNMYSLYIFGAYVETQFTDVFGPAGKWLYLLMYVSSLFFCLLPTYSKNKNNANYRSLGASGAVSAVVFAFIFLEPLRKIGIIFIPFMIPGFIFGFLYLLISSIFDKRGGGNINHSAHIWGALYGISFLIITGSFLARYNLLQSFTRQVTSYIQSF
ncbi:MAG: rhomboid family intramembrane serine protease [Chitinophagaceae bacterium]